MENSERQGCIAVILSLFGIKLASPVPVADELPYRQRDDFLSAAELSFYRVLLLSLNEGFVVCPKVNLKDIIFVSGPREKQQSHRNRIDRKHVDFLLCEPGSMRPVLAIELDDSSHKRRDRQERDSFVDRVFQVATLPLLHVAAAAAYEPQQLAKLIQQALSASEVPPQIEPAEETSLLCPKCQAPMVRRFARMGGKKGQEFWGCSNYPKCRETSPL